MSTFETLHAQWSKHRARLEREIRVLVADDDETVQQQLEALLYRLRISSRAIAGARGINDLVGREHYSLLVVADHLAGMERLRLVPSLRQAHPETDVVVSASRLTVDLVWQAFACGVVEVLSRPIDDDELAGERLRAAVKHNVDRRMRQHVLKQLKNELRGFDEKTRRKVTTRLEQRLAGVKSWVGAFDNVLVVEGDDAQLRYLSENLLVAGMQVETADLFEEAQPRINARGVHLLVLKETQVTEEIPELLDKLREHDPMIELVVVSDQPDARRALQALRHGVALFVPWPPTDAGALVRRIQEIQAASRSDRLMDNLLTALYWETQTALTTEEIIPEERFRAFKELAGMTRPLVSDAEGSADSDQASAVEVLDEVLDHILDRHAPPPQEEEDADGRDRRAHHRVQENQFVRFRPDVGSTSTVAYLGDISEGGVFIRTSRLLGRGTQLEVDVNVEHDGLGYLVRCRGEVAWVAQDNTQVPYGPGFGVRFIDPPRDVVILLQNVVRSRIFGR
jgi:DNA-binding NtrC family response regulator/Tfp pilus assembly protein PilZ